MAEFIILPSRGLRGATIDEGSFLRQAFDAHLAGTRVALGTTQQGFRVLDSIHEDGPKLVDMPAGAASALKATQPGLRVVPVVYYTPMLAPRHRIDAGAGAATVQVSTRWKVRVTDAADRGVPGASVVAFTNFDQRQGAGGTCDANGECQLDFGTNVKTVERLYVYAPSAASWGSYATNVSTATPFHARLRPVSIDHKDVLQHWYSGAEPDNAGAGIVVGVVDTGVDLNHQDLKVVGGANTVQGEDRQDYGDNGESGHGTHVAGVIAGRGKRPAGMRGLAPHAELRSYRVFGRGNGRASNYSIMKAIDQGVTDGCDILNLSLGGPARDEATAEAIDYAYANGTIVIAAAGNDGRRPVSYPAANPLAVGVSALGRKGTFPGGTIDEGDIGDPFGTDPDDFIALFSNFGDGIDVTGPGVGIVSTIPPNTYGAMSGTSMASPAVAGYFARAVSQRPEVLEMARDAMRSAAMIRIGMSAVDQLGFTPEYVGSGLPK